MPTTNEDAGLPGFAHWYEVQAQEERDHALAMRRYLIDCGHRVTFAAVDAPDKAYADYGRAFAGRAGTRALCHFAHHGHFSEAFAQKDFRTMQFLDWFVKEQGEEEKNAEDLVKKMKLFGGDPKGLYLLDQELAARVYSPPRRMHPRRHDLKQIARAPLPATGEGRFDSNRLYFRD